MRAMWRVMIDHGLARPREVLAEGLTHGEAEREAWRQWRERSRPGRPWFSRMWVEREPAPALFSSREAAELMVGAFTEAGR